ncbi:MULTISPECIES: AAA family ATPase [Haloarcula]|uniref:AAA family ATPase n=1 Tax=Haloarcula TaxID=2237 RepID=UPI0023EC2FB5|nr:AAA family ATPase [Halomicroarcula sp. XH51]
MTDTPDREPVESVFGESVTVSTEPFGRFDAIENFEQVKARLKRSVTENVGYDTFATSSVLLFGKSDQSPTTKLARALTGEFDDDYTFFRVGSVSGGFSDSGTNIKATLEAAREREPSVVVLECVDDFAFDEEEYEHLRGHLDSVRTNHSQVLVIATATDDDSDLIRNDALFEFVVDVPEPTEQYRHSEIRSAVSDAEKVGIARLDTHGECLIEDLDTHDLSVRDLHTAVKRAILSRRRARADTPVTIRPTDIQTALDEINAERFDESADAGFFGFASTDEQFEPDVPDISFRDIGGLESEKRRLREAVTIPVEYSETFRDAGYSIGQGILLHGPPGNGKTMLAKAVANELDYHFLSVKGPELEQPLVGESERELRELFGAARDHAPSVVFFDEFDSLAPSRTSDSNEYKDDMVNTLLSELDGLEPLADVLVLAATNRLDQLDAAVLRSGRFDTFIEVPQPDKTDTRAIFEIHADRLPLADPVTADWFVSRDLPDLSGADVAAICRKALEFAVAEFDSGDRESLVVTRRDVQSAVDGLRTESQTDDRHGFR